MTRLSSGHGSGNGDKDLAGGGSEMGDFVSEKRYFISVPPEDGSEYKEAHYAIWIPGGAKTIRAIIMHQHGCGKGAEDSGETATFDVHWQALARKWDCALMGSMYRPHEKCTDWCLPENGSETAFLEAIQSFSDQTGHPELRDVSWVLWGHSGGSTWAYNMFVRHHSKAVAVVLRSGPPIEPFVNTDSLHTPMMFNLGMMEKSDRFAHIWQAANEVYRARRSRDGYTSWAPDPKSSHDCRYSRLLVIPYIDACLEQRLPDAGKGLSDLRPMDAARAWMGDTNTFEIAPVGEYAGDISEATWLPNEAIARKWKEFVETGWVTDITPPPRPVNLRPKPVGATSVEIEWDAEADLESGIKTFFIYRNGERIGSYLGPPERDGTPREHFQKPTYHDNVERPFAEMKYVDHGLKPNTEYEYQVSTVNWSDLESDRSEAVAIRTSPASSR